MLQEKFDIFVFPVIDFEGALVGRGFFPDFIRHAHALEPAGHDALRTVSTAIRMISHDEPFIDFVEDNQLDRIGWAIFDAQLASNAFGGIPIQPAAQSLGRRRFDEWIALCDRAFEERGK